jgi:chromate transporter
MEKLISSTAVFVMGSLSKFLEKKKSIVIAVAFKGMRPAIIGMIFSAVWNIGRGASVSWPTPFIFWLVLLLLLRYKSQAVYLIPLSGSAGIVLYSF